MKSKKTINIVAILNHNHFYEASNLAINSSFLSHQKNNEIHLPQIDLVKEMGLPIGYFGVILTKYEFDKFFKKQSTEFGDFLELLVSSNPVEIKTILVRSSFLELNDEYGLNIINNIFNKKYGFDIKFTIMLDDPIDLLINRFLSSMYQIPSKFYHSNINSFYKFVFKPSLEKIITRLKEIKGIFGEANLEFIHQDFNNSTNNEYSSKLSKLTGINYTNYNFKKNDHDINPIFMEYLRCSILDGKVDIRKEIGDIQHISTKYKINKTQKFKDLLFENLTDIHQLSSELQSIAKGSNFKKTLIIKNEICALNKAIRYIEEKCINK